jgi:hypothetical protein
MLPSIYNTFDYDFSISIAKYDVEEYYKLAKHSNEVLTATVVYDLKVQNK